MPVLTITEQVWGSMPRWRGSSRQGPSTRESRQTVMAAPEKSEMAVEMPAPSASRWKKTMKMMSQITLTTHEAATISEGVRVSPTERWTADPVLKTSEKTSAPK